MLKINDKVMVDITGLLWDRSIGPVTNIIYGVSPPEFNAPIINGLNEGVITDISNISPLVYVCITRDGYKNYYWVTSDRIREVLNYQ